MFRGVHSALLIGVFAVAVLAAQHELVITRGGSEYHRPGCPVISDGKDVLAMSRGQAEARGLKPHKNCDPAQSADPSSAAGARPGGAPPKPVKVFVDADSKYYHREKCAKLGKSPRLVTVDEAAKKHWPCTVCKPPIRPRPKDRAPTEPAGDMPPLR